MAKSHKPMPNLLVWNMTVSIGFSQALITNIDGKNSIVHDQDEMYAIKIFKSDTLSISINIGISEQMNGIIMNYSFKIKVIQD